MSGWVITSAEVQGTSHVKGGIPCQDKTCGLASGKVRAVTLADGAGSAKLSHFGAELMTESISVYVAESFNELIDSDESEIKAVLIRQIRSILDQLSKEKGCDVKELSSTLLLVAVRQDRFLALHIGDGVIGCLHGDTLKVLSAPENGEFANITWFTTATNLERALRIYRGDASRISGFILMSDGVEPSLYDMKENKLANAVMNLFYVNAKTGSTNMRRMLEESLSGTISKRTGDDCSIALMSRTRFKNYDEYKKYRKQVARRK
jgi:hypothetical protein